MLVKFQPSGDVADTTKLTPLVGYSGGPFALPVIGAGLGTTNEYYGGRITSGSVLGHVASAGRSYLIWKTPSNATTKNWQMDSKAATETAIDTIATALAADEALLVLKSDGTAGS